MFDGVHAFACVCSLKDSATLRCGTHHNPLRNSRLTASRRRLCFAERRRLRLAVKRLCRHDLEQITTLKLPLSS
jgi:hypothetical protein